MRFCGIVTSLLLVHNLPPNWTNTFSQNLERSTLTNRPISTPHTHKLTVNCYFRGNPAGPLSKGSKIALIWWAWKDETEAKQPHLSLSLFLLPTHFSHRLFFNEGKAETCLVCFSPSIGSAPAFKAQVLVSRESSFTKTWGGSQVHRGGVNVRRGRLSRLYFSISLSLIVNVFFFQTGQTVCQLPVKQSTTHSS